MTTNIKQPRKNEEYYVLIKRQNNKLSYLRKKHNLNDDTPSYKEWKLLYPELVNITETLNNMNLVISNNKNYSHIKEKLHELIDTIIPSLPEDEIREAINPPSYRAEPVNQP